MKRTLTISLFVCLTLLLAGCSPNYAELKWQAAGQTPFGKEAFSVSSLEVFNDHLYAGLVSGISGARIFRTEDGKTWEPVSEKTFGYPIPEEASSDITYAIWDMVEFQEQLYVGVTWYYSSGAYLKSLGAQVWRTRDGTQWENVVEGGFGNLDFTGVTSFAVFEGQLYAAIDAFSEGFQVWRSPSGDTGSWSQVADDSLGYPNNQAAFLTPFKDKLLISATMWAGDYTSLPVRVWYTEDGATWTPVTTNGFDQHATAPSLPAVFKDDLYLGLAIPGQGGGIWRSSDGLQWTQLETTGFEYALYNFSALFTYDDYLFANASGVPGVNLYYSADGSTWTMAKEASHGDDNTWGLGYNPTAVFKGDLYFGSSLVPETGGDNYAQVWRLCVKCK